MTGLTARINANGPGWVVLGLAGILDQQSVPVLRDAFGRSLSGAPGTVVLDFVDVAEADKEAVVDFPALADQACAWPGAGVAIGGASATVGAVLTGAGVDRQVPMYPSVDEALRAAQPVDDPSRLRVQLEPVDSAAGRARRLVDRACDLWSLAHLRDAARLVATELVSNAVRHATTALEVTLTRRPDAWYVSVRDFSARPPRPGGPVPATQEGGRGLLVVELMSRAWGATPTPDGKVVWACLDIA